MTSCIDDFEQAAVTAGPGGTFTLALAPCSGMVAKRVSLVLDVNNIDTALWVAEFRGAVLPEGSRGGTSVWSGACLQQPSNPPRRWMPHCSRSPGENPRCFLPSIARRS
jgi:hypothetical protein